MSESFHSKNVSLLGKVLQDRRKQGRPFHTDDEWTRYKKRVAQRLIEVKKEALRTKHLTPQEMFMNFLDLVEASSILKELGKKQDERT